MKIVFVVLQLLITGGALLYLSSRIDLKVISDTIANTSASSFFVATLIYFLQFAITSWRLKITLRMIGGRCSFFTALRSVLAGAFFAQTPLSSLGGDMVRVWTLFRGGTSLRHAASAVTLDRLFGSLSLVALILFTLPALWINVNDPRLRTGIVVVLAVFALGVSTFIMLRRIPFSIRNRFRLADWIGQVSTEFHMMLRNKRLSASILAMGLAAHLLSLTIIFVFARDVGISVTFFDVLYLAPFPLLAVLLPISIGGWGVREGAMIVAFALIGVPASETLSASVLFGILSLAVALPGGLLWMLAQFAEAKVPNGEPNPEINSELPPRGT